MLEAVSKLFTSTAAPTFISAELRTLENNGILFTSKQLPGRVDALQKVHFSVAGRMTREILQLTALPEPLHKTCLPIETSNSEQARRWAEEPLFTRVWLEGKNPASDAP
ncbi:hypothetical protein Pcinc_011542 [Petrolisthes cinctipes]|uniref:Uncharacterized protein n=1 Tax=Petrolisthes cinctipes TaxID=88211 RepID=A0AAE1G0N4_PETCI|nr:hypothetical protein Pcinc_011542 [Petrolisthes cinctipes]